MEKKKPTNPKSPPNDNDDNRLLFKTSGRATSVSHYIKDSMTTTMTVQPIAADVAQRDCASRKDKKVHRSKSHGAEEQEESERKEMLKKK